MGERLAETVTALADATRWLGETMRRDPEAALAGATPYLRLFGLAAGGTYLARAALAAVRDDFQALPVALARFFAENLATAAPGIAQSVTSGADAVLGVDPGRLTE